MGRAVASVVEAQTVRLRVCSMSGEDVVEMLQARLVDAERRGGPVALKHAQVGSAIAEITRLRAENEALTAELLRLEEATGMTDPRSFYMNLRTCVCGGDASEHTAPSCGGFDPHWPSALGKLVPSLARAQEPDDA